jgi:tetratricopeptide (TPR) repeat protein
MARVFAFWAAALAAGLLVAAPAQAASGPERDAPDAARVAAISLQAPHAAELLQQGEGLAARGSLEEALRVFRQGRAEDPVDAGFFLRRECETLTTLGRRDEAKVACWSSLQNERTPATIAATVRALVAGPQVPSFGDVGQALLLLRVERSKSLAPQPRLIAAMCDVAESIGDANMLQRCTEDLERVAPQYPPAARARAALDAMCPPWRFWTGWLAIALACAITLADAVRRLLRRSRTGRGPARAAAAVLVLLSLGGRVGPARAELPPAPPQALLSEWAVDDKDPEAHVPPPEQFNRDPLQGGYWLQDILLKADLASKHGDHEAAIKYYRALFKAVPTKATSLSRLCTEYELVGDLASATAACAQALTLDGLTVNDYVHYVHLMLRKPGPLSPTETLAVSNVIQHMRENDVGAEAADTLDCELAVRVSDTPRLKTCTAALVAKDPSNPKTIAFAWALAMQQSDYRQARRLLDQAKAAGMGDDRIKAMEQSIDEGEAHERKWLTIGAVGALVLAAGVVFMVLLAGRRRNVPAPA